uniref:Putative secreted protein n=1 Tax=Anopheles darlingi TaxID=43151 RepID=A0A2M4D954_ANODA
MMTVMMMMMVWCCIAKCSRIPHGGVVFARIGCCCYPLARSFSLYLSCSALQARPGPGRSVEGSVKSENQIR